VLQLTHEKPMKAFLSSTFKDLESYRAAVITRLRRLDGVTVRCMEDFGARVGSPKEFCLREARECDLFIGVIGQLYGFIPDGDETSITEQEYQAAEKAGKDMLIFVAPTTLLYQPSFCAVTVTPIGRRRFVPAC
jgi:hypothetical protein